MDATCRSALVFVLAQCLPLPYLTALQTLTPVLALVPILLPSQAEPVVEPRSSVTKRTSPSFAILPPVGGQAARERGP